MKKRDLRIPVGLALNVLIWLGIPVCKSSCTWLHRATYPEDFVHTTVEYSAGKHCDPDFPLFVWTDNSSRRTVSSVDFTVIIHAPGHSANLAQQLNLPYVSDDQIIPPGESRGGCWRMNKDAKPEFSYEATNRVVEFQ